MQYLRSQTAQEVYILDDDEAVRTTLCMILESGGYKGTCFADDAGLIEAIGMRCPAAILLDVNLPGRSGLEILNHLVDYPSPVIMISGFGNISIAVAAIKAGARDFITKPFKSREILDRLNEITAEYSRGSSTAAQQKLPTLSLSGCKGLTRRERDVICLVATGNSNKEVGAKLGISCRTVEDHRSNVMHKLGVNNISKVLLVVLAGRADS